jgi:hypothetical protein
MAQLTAPRDTPEIAGVHSVYPVAAATILYAGGLWATDANGRLVPASDTAGLLVQGRGEVTADNSAGGAGAITAEVKRSCFKFNNSGTNPITAAMIGKTAYVEDDNTVASTSVNKVVAGKIMRVDSDGIYVQTAGKPLSAAVALASAQNATAAAVDLATAQALATALKASYNALQADVVALTAKLNA